MAEDPEARSPARSGQALLAAAATGLHDQPDLNVVLTWAAQACCEAAGGQDAMVGIFETGAPGRWVPMNPSGSALESLTDSSRHPITQRLLASRTTSLIVGDRLTDLLPETPWAWLLAVPVARPGELAQGVVIVAGSGEPPSDTTVVTALSTHLAVAVANQGDRTRLQISQRQIVHGLQEALLPPPPPLDHTELGRFYIGAENQHSTGGDLYDWLVLPNGDLHFCIVDVMGKGVAATKDASAVTHVLRLLVLDGCALGDVMRRADEILTMQNPELVATAIVGRYSPVTGVVEMAGAGHPPALVVANDIVGQVQAPGIPIGWPGAGSDGTVSVTLDSSSSLILYTDGLVESGRDILLGLEALSRHAAQTAGYPAEHQARALVERSLEGAARYDDSLALVIRRRAVVDGPVRTLGPFRHPIGASPASIPLARHLLGDWLKWQPVGDAAIGDLLLAASELCTNAMRHSNTEGWSALLRASAEGHDIVIEVDDDGEGVFDLEGIEEIPDVDALSGRGLFLVHALTDEVEIIDREGGKTIRCRKRDAISERVR